MTLQFSLTVSGNLQNFDFFLLKSVSRAKNSIWASGVNDFYPQCFVEPSGYALGLQIAPRVKIIHFTPSVHNILFTHLIHHLLSYEYYDNKSANMVPRKCRTHTEKKVASVASLNQLVQHEKKKS
jgi:hypothetical protein